MITYTAPMWVGLVIGFIIGAVAEIWGISNPEMLIRLAKWEDRLFVSCIALGFAIGTPVLFGLYAAGIGFHWEPKPLFVPGILIGGVLFGIGIALSGYFPGAIWMALGEGRRDAVYAVFGGLLGAVTWNALYQTPAGPWLWSALNFGNLIIGATQPSGKEYLIPWDGLTPLDLFGIAVAYAIGMFLLAYYLPRYKGGARSCVRANISKRRTPVEVKMHEETARFLTEGGLPYSENSLAKKLNEYYAVESNVVRWFMVLAGAIVALADVASMFMHQIFGETTTYAWIAGYLFMPSFKFPQIAFKGIGWEPYNDVGTLLGAFFASVFLTRRFTAFRNIIPPSWAERFGTNAAKRFLASFTGGYLLVLAGMIANGCASGHILSGGLQMSLSAMLFTATVFATMLITAHFLYSKRA